MTVSAIFSCCWFSFESFLSICKTNVLLNGKLFDVIKLTGADEEH